MKMNDSIGKEVVLFENTLWGGNRVQCGYRGVLQAVDEHMIAVDVVSACLDTLQKGVWIEGTGQVQWFNTMASTFSSFFEL